MTDEEEDDVDDDEILKSSDPRPALLRPGRSARSQRAPLAQWDLGPRSQWRTL